MSSVRRIDGMKTVLFIIDSLNCGGAEKSLVSLLPLLDYSQMDVSLSIVRRGGVFEQYLPSEVRLIPFPKPGPVGRFFSNALFSVSRRVLAILGIKRHGAEVAWICKRPFVPKFKEHFDVAVSYQQGFPTYFLANKVNSDKKVAWINTDMLNAGYRPHFNRQFYDRMDCVCTVSDPLSGRLSDAGFVSQDKIRVIKDILNVDVIKSLSDVPMDTFKTQKSIKILTVGRLAFPKNYRLAIETADVLREKGLMFIWVFVGEGDERELLETMIRQKGLQDQIILAGLQLNPYPYFKSCDIYVQTSSFEGFGLTLSEAKILHKPIVTTNFPSAINQIHDGKNGLIAEMTPKSIAEKILRLVNDHALMETIIRETKNEQNRTAETESVKVNQLLTEI